VWKKFPSKRIFWACQGLTHYSRTKTDRKFLSPFQVGQKWTNILYQNFPTTRYNYQKKGNYLSKTSTIHKARKR
jgi:hypothetical protein